jgi:hypothetical protein
MSAPVQKITQGKAVACSVCARAAFFLARIEYPAGPQFARRRAPACATHLVEVMQALCSWARSRQLAGGRLTVLAIDPYALPRLTALGVADPGLPFYWVPITRPAATAGPEAAGPERKIRYA